MCLKKHCNEHVHSIHKCIQAQSNVQIYFRTTTIVLFIFFKHVLLDACFNFSNLN